MSDRTITYPHLAADEAMLSVAALQEVYAAVFSLPPYHEGPEMVDKFADWLRDESKLPGFDLVEARYGRDTVGFAYGFTKPAGIWWERTDRPAPPEVVDVDLFAVMEWAVLPAYRGAGMGRRLMDELLFDRPERYATLLVNPAAEARGIYLRWGWRHVASTKAGKLPAMHVLLTPITAQQGPDE
jgi:ribosomal protein S18 acetylase RimI-like enzyme